MKIIISAEFVFPDIPEEIAKALMDDINERFKEQFYVRPFIASDPRMDDKEMDMTIEHQTRLYR